MSSHVFWVIQANIKEGQYDAFKALMEEMVAATEANEPGALAYEWFISDDKKSCHIYERYADSEATMAHLGNFGKTFASRFMSMLEMKAFNVYGAPNEGVQKALTGAGAKIIGPWGGFRR